MHHKSGIIFFFQQDQFCTERLSQMKRSKAVSKKPDKYEWHFLLFFEHNFHKYDSTHATLHSRFDDHLSHSECHHQSQSESDQRCDGDSHMRCICIWSRTRATSLQYYISRLKIVFHYAALNPKNRNSIQRNENSLWKQKQKKFQHRNAKCCEIASGLSRQNLVVVMGNRMKTKFRWWVDFSSMTSKSIWSCDSLPWNSRRQKDLKVRCLSTQNRKHGMNIEVPLRQKQIIYS